uniref:Uncharacterized protein n=1 Tax=Tanacetum cinerariifolium TaxID=118510 RepID=A0A699HYS0_TANCI|nr:hypothetical protein [Tanacetum cinerariifolium]
MQGHVAVGHYLDEDLNKIPSLYKKLSEIRYSLSTHEALKFVRAGGKPYVWPVWPGKEAYVARLNREETRATTHLNEIIIRLVISTNMVPSVPDALCEKLQPIDTSPQPMSLLDQCSTSALPNTTEFHVHARMDQVQNQLNQVLMMMQNAQNDVVGMVPHVAGILLF